MFPKLFAHLPWLAYKLKWHRISDTEGLISWWSSLCKRLVHSHVWTRRGQALLLKNNHTKILLSPNTWHNLVRLFCLKCHSPGNRQTQTQSEIPHSRESPLHPKLCIELCYVWLRCGCCCCCSCSQAGAVGWFSGLQCLLTARLSWVRLHKFVCSSNVFIVFLWVLQMSCN